MAAAPHPTRNITIDGLLSLLRTRPDTVDETSHNVLSYVGYLQQLPYDLIAELKKFLASDLWKMGGTLVGKHRILLAKTQILSCVLRSRYAVILPDRDPSTYCHPAAVVSATDELLISIYDLLSGDLVKELRVAGLLEIQDCGPELGAAIMTHKLLLFLLPSLELRTACSLPPPDEKHQRLGLFTWMHPIVHMPEWGLVLLPRNGRLYAWNAKTQQLHDVPSASLTPEISGREHKLLGAWSKYLSVGFGPEERLGLGRTVLYELVSASPQPLFCQARLGFLPPGTTPITLLPGGYLHIRLRNLHDHQVYSLDTGLLVSGTYPAPSGVTAHRSPQGDRVIVIDTHHRPQVYIVWLDETRSREISIRCEYMVQQVYGTHLITAMQSCSQMRVFDPLKDGEAECGSIQLHPPFASPLGRIILRLVDDYCLFLEWHEESNYLLVMQLHVY